MMNSIILTGRLVNDPELRYQKVTGNAISYFALEVQRRYKNKENLYEKDYFPCISSNKSAEYIANNFKKGVLIELKGRIIVSNNEIAEGIDKTVNEVLVQNIKKIDWKEDNFIKANECKYDFNENKFNESAFKIINNEDLSF